MREFGATMGFVALLVALQWGCGDAPESGQAAIDSTAAASPAGSRVVAPDGSFEVELPSRWTRHYRIDSLSTAERGRARPGAIVFSYLPSDSTIRPQAMAVIAVYDSAAWAAVIAEGGPPPGDSVAARAGLVYVVGLPQSNPFPPSSADAVLFQLLQLKPAELAGLVRPR